MLSSCRHMAATLMKKNKACKLVKFSQSDDNRGDNDEADKGDYAVPEGQKLRKGEVNASKKKSGKPEEVEGREESKDQRPPCLQRRWGKIESLRLLRRRSEEGVKMQDRPFAVVFRGRQGKQVRKTTKKTDGREVEEQKKHDDKRSTMKTDKDKEYPDKDTEHEICVSSWNINKSSARYNFLRDVAMFQETQNRHQKTAIAVRKKNTNLLKHARRSTRWVLIVLESILFLSLCLPHTWWDGELNLEEYYNTLREVDENMQDIKQKFHVSGIIAGMDAQVEIKPHQEPFVGGGTRVYRGTNTKYCEMEAKFESLLMEWITKHDVKLTNTFSRGWEPTRVKTNKLDLWEQNEMQLQKWKIIDCIAAPINWETRSTVARNCCAQNLTDLLHVLTRFKLPERKRTVASKKQQCFLERMEANDRK